MPHQAENFSFVSMGPMTSGERSAPSGHSPITPLLVDDITMVSLEVTTQGSELGLAFIYL